MKNIKVFIVVLFTILTSNLYSQVERTEQYIKARYIYNFINMVNWNEINSTTFNICIYGNVALVKELKSYIKDKLIRGKTVNIYYINKMVDIQSDNQILVVTYSKKDFMSLNLKNTFVIGNNFKWKEYIDVIFNMENGRIKYYAYDIEKNITISSTLFNLSNNKIKKR